MECPKEVNWTLFVNFRAQRLDMVIKYMTQVSVLPGFC